MFDHVATRRVGYAVALLAASVAGRADEPGGAWPSWRGPRGDGVASGAPPVRWGASDIAWGTAIPGEGNSSPVLSGERIFVTSSGGEGSTRLVHCLDRNDGTIVWSRSIECKDPERTSSATGWAASTPATDGERVVAVFGNAGVVAYDFAGRELWRRELGVFDTELGTASSPLIREGRIFVVCDHDGDRFRSFDSYIVALDAADGRVLWKTERPGLFRSWSTPAIAPAPDASELVVAGQESVRAYALADGREVWSAGGLNDWVTPSPVWADGLWILTSGKSGPVMALRGGGRDPTATQVVWKHESAGSYVPSPIADRGRVWVLRETGVLTAYRAASGEELFRARLRGKHTASPIAASGYVYFTAEDGMTTVIRASDSFEPIAENPLDGRVVASAAVGDRSLFFRTETRVVRISASPLARAVRFLAAEVDRWPRENHCFSCHNNGDGAGALFAVDRAGVDVDVDPSLLSSTLDWLTRPGDWERSPGDEAWSDPRLARLQFAGALVAALDAGAISDHAVLATVATEIAADQRDDGSWNGGSADRVGSPTAYSRILSTQLALEVLRSAGGESVAGALRRGEDWLDGIAIENTHRAAVILRDEARRAAPRRARIDACFDELRAGRDAKGAWGPYRNSPSEIFDTALALTALARAESAARTEEIPPSDELHEWIVAARGHLEREQETDGSWPETTRPSGGDSYAQRISTTAWALRALAATRTPTERTERRTR